MRAESPAVLGGGAWGTTIAHVLALGGHAPRLWLRDAEVARAISDRRENPRFLPGERLADGIRPVLDLTEALDGAQVVFVAVPVRALREVARAAATCLGPDTVLVSCAKGLEAGSCLRPSEVLASEVAGRPAGVLAGPTIAPEVVRGHPSACVVASKADEVIRLVGRLLMSGRLRVYGNHDVVGVEVCGAAKNVIAIASGMARGFGFGENTRALLITRGLAEVRRYCAALGADPDTVSGLAGVGDLVVTCSSPLSRNHQVGYRLARGERLPAILSDMRQVAEGVSTCEVIHGHASALGIEVPIASSVRGIIHGGLDPARAVEALMSRQARYEVDLAAEP